MSDDCQLICSRERLKSLKKLDESQSGRVKGSHPEIIRTVEGLRNFEKFTEIHQKNYFVEHVWILIWKYQIFIMESTISLSVESFMNH